eukprot:CAMPEP_0176104688 /NCGR_PEP_ID=MMETSP0120_2-20121206/52532_1 /TAXON_ID=160619 /ORGANISM="Kryptoperidinium foliaceum, Strain CCMP 1326" /LENGTH=71 /DNA_ID=CAMNT_0017438797 /DNA_START=104 /DNA_END=316 /DNA_ORIENTATION=-
MTMESQPPNDPNRNFNNHQQQARGKMAPYDGRNRRNNNGRSGENDEPMDVMGDLREAPAAVVMFLVGVAAW